MMDGAFRFLLVAIRPINPVISGFYPQDSEFNEHYVIVVAVARKTVSKYIQQIHSEPGADPKGPMSLSLKIHSVSLLLNIFLKCMTLVYFSSNHLKFIPDTREELFVELLFFS